MAADWQRLCRSRDVAIDGEMVLVSLPGSRMHRVSVTDQSDAFRLSSVVVRASIAAAVDSLPLHVWERNRGTELVGFKIDAKGA